jgi:hypothetical protein
MINLALLRTPDHSIGLLFFLRMKLFVLVYLPFAYEHVIFADGSQG